jgi:hypothetical protein
MLRRNTQGSMDVRNFSIARDLLYLSGALMGVTAGYILSLFKKYLSIRSRNRLITVIFIAFSGVLAAFSAALVVSSGDIFSLRGLFFAAAAGVPVFALAVFFPRAAAYPLVLAGGLLTVWLGYSFLQFPPAAGAESPLAYVRPEGAGRYSIRLPPQRVNPGDRAKTRDRTGAVPAEDRSAAAVFQISGNQPPLDIEAAHIRFHPWYPLIGGTGRGLITLIRRGDEVLYADRRLENLALKNWYALIDSWGVVFQNVNGTVPLETIPRGADMAVSFTGGALSFPFVRQSF